MANDGQKPVTFRNQAGQILQATPITVVAAGNQPTTPSFPTTGDATLGTPLCSQQNTHAGQMNGFPQQQTSVTSLATQQVPESIDRRHVSIFLSPVASEFFTDRDDSSNKFFD